MKNMLFTLPAKLRGFINPYMILGAVLVLGSVATGSYVTGAKHAKNKFEAQTAREERIAQTAYDKAIAAAAESIANIQINHRTIRQELEREIRLEPVYVDCQHSDSVKRLLDSILEGEAPPESITRTRLSRADALSR